MPERRLDIRWPSPGQGQEQYVPGRVNVPMQTQAATGAVVSSNRQGFFDDATASRASLACISGIDDRELGTSFLDFVPNRLQERRPCGVGDRTGQPAVLEHVANPQAFRSYQSVSTSKTTTQFVDEILPPVGNAAMNLLEREASLAPTVGTPAPPGKPSVGDAKFGQGELLEPRVGDVLAVRRRKEGLEAHVDSDGGLGTPWYDNVLNFAGQDQEPLIGLALDRQSLDLAENFPVNIYLDAPDSGYPQPTVLEATTIAMRREQERVETVGGLEPRKAGLALLGLEPAEEVLERPVKSTHRCLGRREVEAFEKVVGLSFGLEPRGLVAVVDADLVPRVGLYALSEASVIEMAVRVEDGRHVPFLGLGRVEAEFVGASHPLLALLVLYVLPDDGFGDVSASPDVVRAAPERRELAPEFRELVTKFVAGEALELAGDVMRGEEGRGGDEDVNVVRHDLGRLDGDAEGVGLLLKKLLEAFGYRGSEDFAPEFWAPNKVVVEVVAGVVRKFAWHIVVSSNYILRSRLGYLLKILDLRKNLERGYSANSPAA